MKNIRNVISSRMIIIASSLFVLTLVLLSISKPVQAETFNRQMELGMSGSDISTLQRFLSQDVSIYPQGLITGYFGFLTKAAVSNFQSRNGISSVGRVGPATLPVLNLQVISGIGGGGTMVNTGSIAPTITNISLSTSRNGAVVNWSTDEASRGLIYYSSSPLNLTEYINSVTSSGQTAMSDNTMRSYQSVSIQGLSSNTTYYYMIYTTDQDGNVSVSWPSTFVTNI